MSIELAARLRSGTRDEHKRLEDALGLSEKQPTAARFTEVLQDFLGFHLAWEPEVAASPELASVFAGRSRLPHLRSDLLALGLEPDEVERLPRCESASQLARDPRAALGSLYVMEGSTLGGQVISQRITDASWAPSGGLTYFNPYGSEVGRRWRTLQTVLDAAPPPDHDAIMGGALATFATLLDWMRTSAPAESSGVRAVHR